MVGVAETDGLDEVGVLPTPVVLPTGVLPAGVRPVSDLPPPPKGTKVGLGGSAVGGAEEDGLPEGRSVGGLNASGVN